MLSHVADVDTSDATALVSYRSLLSPGCSSHLRSITPSKSHGPLSLQLIEPSWQRLQRFLSDVAASLSTQQCEFTVNSIISSVEQSLSVLVDSILFYSHPNALQSLNSLLTLCGQYCAIQQSLWSSIDEEVQRHDRIVQSAIGLLSLSNQTLDISHHLLPLPLMICDRDGRCVNPRRFYPVLLKVCIVQITRSSRFRLWRSVGRIANAEISSSITAGSVPIADTIAASSYRTDLDVPNNVPKALYQFHRIITAILA